ncbi:MAG: hypothetical protein HFJ17_05965 [Clostridia bacterium]|nr:hypothetical protein [Clostridia bacterium]
MLITVLFWIASICLIIFTVVYTRKMNNFYKFKSKSRISITRQKNTIKSIWNIERIKGSIITTNDRYCKHSVIIELGSIEYKLLNEEEQNNIDEYLISISKTIKNQIQFYSTVEKIDTTNKIENIKNNLKQRNVKIQEYGKNIIEYLDDIMKEDDLYVRKNYLIVSSNETLQKAQQELQDIYYNIKYSFSNINIATKLLSDEEIIELIYKELNKNSPEKIKNIIDKGGMDFYVGAKEERIRKENFDE